MAQHPSFDIHGDDISGACPTATFIYESGIQFTVSTFKECYEFLTGWVELTLMELNVALLGEESPIEGKNLLHGWLDWNESLKFHDC